MKVYKFKYEIRSGGDTCGMRDIAVRGSNIRDAQVKARNIMIQYAADYYPGAWVRLDKTYRDHIGPIPFYNKPFE